MNLKNFNFLIVGQLKTSRTETLEEYLRNRVNTLGVIGFMSPFASYNESRGTLYKQGIKSQEFPLLCFVIKRVTWWKRPLMCISFGVYIFSVFFAVIRLKSSLRGSRRNVGGRSNLTQKSIGGDGGGLELDFCIGIATFSAMLGILLRRLGFVKKVIYYCIDYYPPSNTLGFKRLENIIYRKMDAWLLKRADIVWEISPRIKEARQRYMDIPANSYKGNIVPLGYSNNIYRDCPLDKKERWTLGFVGTLSENQGLQLVIEAMPSLTEKFPEIKVRVLGHGPYAVRLKELAKKNNVENRFIFHGFIKDDNEVYDILARCMAGLATWTGDETDNSLYADPGKPKLYALLGLPIIITSAPYVSKIIFSTRAGEVINYKVNDFIIAVEKIIGAEERYLLYKNGVERFKPYCLAENIFNQSFTQI